MVIKCEVVNREKLHASHKCNNTGKEPSPKGNGFCARNESVGTKMQGQDGKMWIVARDKNGRFFWQRLSSRRRTSSRGQKRQHKRPANEFQQYNDTRVIDNELRSSGSSTEEDLTSEEDSSKPCKKNGNCSESSDSSDIDNYSDIPSSPSAEAKDQEGDATNASKKDKKWRAVVICDPITFTGKKNFISLQLKESSLKKLAKISTVTKRFESAGSARVYWGKPLPLAQYELLGTIKSDKGIISLLDLKKYYANAKNEDGSLKSDWVTGWGKFVSTKQTNEISKEDLVQKIVDPDLSTFDDAKVTTLLTASVYFAKKFEVYVHKKQKCGVTNIMLRCKMHLEEEVDDDSFSE